MGTNATKKRKPKAKLTEVSRNNGGIDLVDELIAKMRGVLLAVMEHDETFHWQSSALWAVDSDLERLHEHIHQRFQFKDSSSI